MRAASAEVIQAYASSTSFFFITISGHQKTQPPRLAVLLAVCGLFLQSFAGFGVSVGYSSSKKMIGSMFLNHQQ